MSQDAQNNQNGNQKTCASSCGVNQANVEAGTASAPGATQVNANHIIQYPRQPKYTDGKWISLGSLLGAILGRFAAGSTIKKAKDAESDWNKINRKLHDKGLELFDLAPKEWDKAQDADNDLQNHYKWNVDRRDGELGRAEKLDNCNDTLHEKVCQFAQCGYQPDYDGIKSRIMADVQAQTKKARKELCKNLNRYSVRQCCNIETQLATQAIATTVTALFTAREDERARAWQINEGLLFKTTELMEKHRNGRMETAMTFDKTGIGVQEKRYANHNGNYFDLNKLGGDFLSSAGRNYAYLAESYRKTAEKSAGSMAQLGALIATVLGAWFLGDDGDGCTPQDNSSKLGKIAGGNPTAPGGGGGLPNVNSTGGASVNSTAGAS